MRRHVASKDVDPPSNICKLPAQLIVNLVNERHCMSVVKWQSRRVHLHPIGYVMSIFAVYRWWKGVTVLCRRWSDLTRSFASAPRLVNIPSIYTAMGVGSTSYQLLRGSMSTMRIRKGQHPRINSCRQIWRAKKREVRHSILKALERGSELTQTEVLVPADNLSMQMYRW